MSKKNDCWGIEVGANAIKAMRLIREGSQITLADFDVLPFKQILTTPDLDVVEAIQVNLGQFVQRHDVSRSTIMVSVAGHMAFARFAKLPPVDPKKIPDIVKFEAVQQIPFPIEQVEWDYQVFEQADSPDVEVGIFAIMRERVMDFLDNYRAAGISVDGLTLSPLAVYNALAHDMDLKSDAPGTILMDIGTTSTDVVVAEEGHTWIRTLPLGGNNFTEALVRSFKLGFPKAEKLKREAATSKYARQIYVAMRPVFADLVQEIQRSLGYYQSLNRNANLTQLIGLGSTFRLPGLRKFLKQQLQIEVIRPDGFRRLTVEGKRASDLSNHALNLATAYGLALQGLGQEKVSANILPKHILKQRLWRSKQPWIGAAAALLVAATAAAGARLWSDRKAVESSESAYAPVVDDVVQRGEALRKAWEDIEVNDSREQIENLQRIPDYREVWPKALNDIYLGLITMNPQPELFKPVYDRIQSIPRGDRRRVHLYSIKSEYVYSYQGRQEGTGLHGAMGGLGPVRSVGTKIEKFDPWNPPRADEDDEDSLDESAESGTATGVRYPPPSLVVTIRGATTHTTGRELLTTALQEWLKENGKRDDRPYTIIPLTRAGTPGSDDGIVSWKRVDQSMRGPGSQGRVARPFNPMLPGRAGPPGGLRPGASRSNPLGGSNRMRSRPRSSSARSPLAGSGGTSTYQDLFPTCPLDLESRQHDWEFEILWQIEMKKPRNARGTENVPDQPQDEQVTSKAGSSAGEVRS